MKNMITLINIIDGASTILKDRYQKLYRVTKAWDKIKEIPEKDNCDSFGFYIVYYDNYNNFLIMEDIDKLLNPNEYEKKSFGQKLMSIPISDNRIDEVIISPDLVRQCVKELKDNLTQEIKQFTGSIANSIEAIRKEIK